MDRLLRPAVFLDRDDTLIHARALPPPKAPAAPGDVCDPALVTLLPGTLEACQALTQSGFALVVFSNQGVVARGGATLERVEAVNDRLRELLLGLVEAIYVCPFHPRGSVPRFTREHPWRKPGPEMVLAATEELGLDLERSWLVGDAERDVEAGVAAGLARERCLLLSPGSGIPDLGAAAAVILARADH